MAEPAERVEPAAIYQSLYRRYRPQRFDEVLGQDHITRALRNAVREGRVGHAYLFSGPRGTGKTSTARILAKVLNCAAPVDGEPDGVCDNCRAVERGQVVDWLLEQDAASKSKVDDMRDLLERVPLGTSGNRKVIILDEVHMLSQGAENALLKTLEEPPAHVVFVLATTDPQKVRPTIRSRTQHFAFRLLPQEVLAEHVRQVIADANLSLADEADAVDHVVRTGGGSARDTLSALDQVAALGEVVADSQPVEAIVDALAARDAGAALVAVAEACVAGRDPRALGEAVIVRLRDAFLALMGVPEAQDERARALGDRLGAAGLTRALDVLGEALTELSRKPDPRVVLEVALVRLVRPEADRDIPAVLDRLDRLERAVQTGAVPAAATSASPSDPTAAGAGGQGPAPGPAERSAAVPTGSAQTGPGAAAAAPEPGSASSAAPASPAAPAGSGPSGGASGGRPADGARAALAARRGKPGAGGGTPQPSGPSGAAGPGGAAEQGGVGSASDNVPAQGRTDGGGAAGPMGAAGQSGVGSASGNVPGQGSAGGDGSPSPAGSPGQRPAGESGGPGSGGVAMATAEASSATSSGPAAGSSPVAAQAVASTTPGSVATATAPPQASTAPTGDPAGSAPEAPPSKRPSAAAAASGPGSSTATTPPGAGPSSGTSGGVSAASARAPAPDPSAGGAGTAGGAPPVGPDTPATTAGSGAAATATSAGGSGTASGSAGAPGTASSDGSSAPPGTAATAAGLGTPATTSPAGGSGTAPGSAGPTGAGGPGTGVDLTTLSRGWSDKVLGELPIPVRSKWRGGSWLDAAGGTARFRVPNEWHKKACDGGRLDVERALTAHFGQQITVEVVVEDPDGSGPGAPPGAGSPGPPSSATPAQPGGPPTPPEPDDVLSPDEVRELEDAKDVATGGVDLLLREFGGELVEEDP